MLPHGRSTCCLMAGPHVASWRCRLHVCGFFLSLKLNPSLFRIFAPHYTMPFASSQEHQGVPGRRRTNCRYTAQEREVLEAYKESYLEATSSQERLAIVKGELLPAIFTYWSEMGTAPKTPEGWKSSTRVSNTKYIF
jgi:hypothetical protein